MAQKQGGKATNAAVTRALAPTAKDRRFLSHCKRMGKSPSELQSAGACMAAPFADVKQNKEREFRAPIPMAALRELPNVAQQGGGFVIADGVILEAHVSTQALHAAFNASHTIPRRIVRQTPLGLSIVAEVLR